MRTRRTKFGIMHYVPPKAPGVLYRNTIQALATGKQPLRGPVRLHVSCVFLMPVSWSKSRRHKHDGQPHAQKPDADNVAKAVMDGLTASRIWPDDDVVAVLLVEKVWGDKPLTTILVSELTEGYDDDDETTQLASDRTRTRDASAETKGGRKPTGRRRRGVADCGNPWRLGEAGSEGAENAANTEG
jgi:Holliday junction resolvase RusA-like endonuclease